ncbi:MAG TPA: Tim44/TimA family putative adaptor protein [Stellaceae bacterium]|nr:Tim44/TimA family putative adaptor protein [Stellaceae bacterium]
MGNGFQFIDIILFAAIAGFLVLRLRSVLGRRTGTERRRDPFAAPTKPVLTPPPQGPAAGPIIEGTVVPLPASPPGGIAGIKAAEPGFAEDVFLKGARGAFEIIVNAFAAGDSAALKPLLSPEVYRSFAEAIEARLRAKESMQTTLVSMKSAEIAGAVLEGKTARITAKFVSEQINVTRDAAGKVIEGDPERVIEHCDFWTFARTVGARDPNWMLVATQSP